jgi:hypothetical protein
MTHPEAGLPYPGAAQYSVWGMKNPVGRLSASRPVADLAGHRWTACVNGDVHRMRSAAALIETVWPTADPAEKKGASGGSAAAVVTRQAREVMTRRAKVAMTCQAEVFCHIPAKTGRNGSNYLHYFTFLWPGAGASPWP